jgi:hypothetical protein
MSGRPQPSAFFIGWDVGGWNCDKNGKSRDAVVILDAKLKLVGRPWRGNLRTAINTATNASDWVNWFFSLCVGQSRMNLWERRPASIGIAARCRSHRGITIAIGTPL